MGRLTEYFAYLKCDPKNITELNKELCRINITQEMKAERRSLKLYNETNID